MLPFPCTVESGIRGTAASPVDPTVVPIWIWGATLVVLGGIIVLDLLVIARRSREVTTRDALRWIGVYVGLAAIFAAVVYLSMGPSSGLEFIAGYITEYSLSVDNLFVFVIIMARFAVPPLAQDKALYIGIVLSLLLRTVFIIAGAAAIAAASWLFYLLGAFLIYTAVQLLREGENDEDDFRENWVLRRVRRVLPLVPDYEGDRIVVRVDDARRLTPLILVVVAIGIANVIFALDSIPAIFGLTTNAYIIFTANALALMGLRQLYFIIGRLLERIVYLNVGLAVILGFIGVKLVIEALHASHIDDIGPMHIPEIGIVPSLSFIVGVLVLTTVFSMIKSRRA